tara:strand:+ start:345 stop:593 length:249 start_codon:yes stop_codon:yes gene_type:complete
MHKSIYRGYDIVEYDTEWKVELDNKSVSTFEKVEGVSGEASCMCEIDRIKRQERLEIDASIQRVDAQVKLNKDIQKARNNGS